MKCKTRISLFLEKRMLRYFSARAKKRRPGSKCNKLLIARTDGVGDYILWLSVEQEIRKRYPDACIEMMLDERKPTEELVCYDGAVDAYFSLPIVGWRRFLSVLYMRKKKYDVIIQPVYSRLAFTDLLIFAARASERITIDSNGQFFLSKAEWKWSDHGYDRVLPCEDGTRHELIRCAELARGLGVSDFRACLPDIGKLELSPAILGDTVLPKQYIMVFPSGSWSGKIWSSDNYVQVIRWLLGEFDGVIYLCGDVQDAARCRNIQKRVRSRVSSDKGKHLKTLAGKLDLAQLAIYIKGAQLIFGNDTGAIHIAAASRVKAVAVTAEREIGRFMPYKTECPEEEIYFPVCVHLESLSCSGCLMRGEQICRYREKITEVVPCISKISVRQVREAIGEMIADQ